jgi:hypothetical protein
MPAPVIVNNESVGVVPPEESIVLQTLKETLGEGKATPPAPDIPPVPDAPSAPEVPPADEPPPAKPAEQKKAEPDFLVFGEDGKTPVTPAKMLFEFKANGKIRQEPLDRVVQFAQLGVYNHEREQRLQERESETQQEVESVYAELDQREAAIERLLTDPAYFEQVQTRFAREKSPEREADRAKAEAKELRERMQGSEQDAQGQTFFETVVYPEIDAMTRENTELDTEEVAARLALMLEPLRINGRIPPARHRQVEALIKSDLGDWARATNARRTARYTSAVSKAQAHEQRAKNAQGAAASPATVGTGPSAPRERTGPVTVEDVDNEILLDTIRSIKPTG